MKVMNVEFAPLDLPMERRLQTFAALCFCSTALFLGPGSYLLLGYTIFFTQFYWVALVYIAFCLGERNIATRGGRPVGWVRRWTWWKLFRDYFPAELVKTAELDPKKNYLMCVFPHGLLSYGASLSFGTEAMNVSQLFPGIRPSTITLHQNFKMPIVRELLLSMGGCSASKESLNYLMSDPEGGRAAVLVVGGAAESLQARAGDYHLVLKNRKGFVKLALRNGASLVPVFSFGETDLYDQWDNPEGSWLRSYQDWFKKVTGIAPVVPLGRGVFQYSFGMMPKRRPIHTVVGKPMDVQKVLEPTQEQIDQLHTSFVNNLTALFNDEKGKYLKDAENVSLIIE